VLLLLFQSHTHPPSRLSIARGMPPLEPVGSPLLLRGDIFAEEATAAALRAELGRLDRELEDATASLRDRRDIFARQVAAHDTARSERSHEVQAALCELEASRGRMDILHRELMEGRGVVAMLEAECGELEYQLSLGGGDEHGVEEGDLERRHFDLAAHHSLVGHTPSDDHAQRCCDNARASGLPQTVLRRALDDFFNEALAAAECTAMRIEKRLEQATCRVGASAAATRVLSAALARRSHERSRVWCAESASLLSALDEAEDIAEQQLVRQRQAFVGSAVTDTEERAELLDVFALRLEVASELRTGLAEALAPWAA